MSGAVHRVSVGDIPGLGFGIPLYPKLIRKILLVSVKFFVRNSGAGNGCANFMGAWKKCALSAGNKPMSIKFVVLGGGGYFGFFFGGGVPILFLCARGFF